MGRKNIYIDIKNDKKHKPFMRIQSSELVDETRVKQEIIIGHQELPDFFEAFEQAQGFIKIMQSTSEIKV